MSLVTWLETTGQDLRYATRTLRRHCGLSAVIVLTLALAIGANTAIFSLMDALLLRALPVRDPQGLVLLQWSAHAAPNYGNISSYGDCVSRFAKINASGCSFSLPFFHELQQRARGFAALTAFGGGGLYNVSGHGNASTARAQVVAGNYFQTLGIGPAVGRMLAPSDDTAAAPAVMVLSYAYWQSAFGGAPDVVGRSIALNNVPVTIVGVADRRFSGLTPGSVYDGWLPLALRARLMPGWDPSENDADSVWLVMVGRLRPGVPIGQAQAEVSGLFRNAMLDGAKPFSKPADAPAVALAPAQSALRGVRGAYTQPLVLLMWTVGAILLTACANVAGLLLGRASARQKELALRRALGAGGGRILRQLLTESLLLAGLGGVLGLGLAYAGAHALLAMMASGLSRPLGLAASIDARVLLFTLAATLVTGLLFGLAPALRGARMDLTRSLKDGVGNSASSGGRRYRWLHLGNGLAVAQIALCMVMLAGAGLLVRTLENLRNVDPGFDTNSLLLFSVEPATIGYKGAAVIRLYDQIQNRIGAIPGVLETSYSEFPLLAGGLSRTSFHLGGKSGPEVRTDILSVGLNFFSAMHMRLLLGRDFVPTDFVPEPDAPPPANSKAPPRPPSAAIVNETFVRQFLGKGNPLGRHFGDAGSRGWVVVGVVRDAKYQNLREEVAPTTYTPSVGGYASFEVRTAGNPMAILPAVRRAVRDTDANLPLIQPTTQAQTIDQLLFQERLLAQLSSFFGLLALLLACIGLYGLLSQEVTRRTREIGIRMALGAQRGDVLRLVIRLGAVLAAIGVAIGLGGAWGLTRYLRSMLYGVGATDPITLGAVGALLLAVALVACAIPARRATRVDPLVALRHE